MIKNEFFVLNNGVKIPKVGFGTWQITERSECIKSILWAIDSGYTHLDTAAAYKNEEFIRDALLLGNHKRESLFITSKLHATKKGYDVTVQEFNDTLARLGTDYLDLYLIHAPRPWGDVSNIDYMPLNIESWKAMEDLYKAGKIKAIGVSNFNKDQLQQLIHETEIKPMVNQIKVHIGSSNKEIKEYCDQMGILVEAYSPNASGKIFGNVDIQKVATKYGVSVSQLANRWCLQYGTLPLPKSVHQDRIIENIDLDFDISKEDMEYLTIS
jgi:diketogulonate reductase-like aldo/keto reductase